MFITSLELSGLRTCDQVAFYIIKHDHRMTIYVSHLTFLDAKALYNAFKQIDHFASPFPTHLKSPEAFLLFLTVFGSPKLMSATEFFTLSD